MTLQEFIDKATLQAKIGLDRQAVTARLELIELSYLGYRRTEKKAK
jgi:hypothetical protein